MLFRDDQAAEIVAFVEGIKDGVKGILVHCEAGVSRSAAVAAVIELVLNGSNERVFNVHLNGKLTLGENTADNGGMHVAYMALQKALAGHESKPIDGFTPEQRFFLGYANIWCQNVTEQAARQLAQTDPHSAGEFRVNGAVSNMPEFWEAFSCKKGQPMVRESACRAW